jgi:hypothetical protein
MADTELRRWLRKHPHPAIIRVWDSDDEEKTIKVGVSRSKWRDAEAACEAYPKLEALDAEGNILRTLEFEHDGGAQSVATKNGSSTDPETVRLLKVAELLADAADKAAARHEAAYRLGFDHQATLINVLSNRLASLEKAWHNMIMNQAPVAEGDPNEAMLKSLIPFLPALMGAGMKTPPPEPNGKQ